MTSFFLLYLHSEINLCDFGNLNLNKILYYNIYIYIYIYLINYIIVKYIISTYKINNKYM